MRVITPIEAAAAMELSKAAAVTEVSLSRYMHGMRIPSAVALHNIAVALDTTMEYLITGEREVKE